MIFSSPGLRKHTCDRLKHTWSGCGCELWTHVCRRPLDLALAWSCINIHKPHFKHCFSSERADRPRVSGAVRGILDKESRDRVCVCVCLCRRCHTWKPALSSAFLSWKTPNQTALIWTSSSSTRPAPANHGGRVRREPGQSGAGSVVWRDGVNSSTAQCRKGSLSPASARQSKPEKQIQPSKTNEVTL